MNQRQAKHSGKNQWGLEIAGLIVLALLAACTLPTRATPATATPTAGAATSNPSVCDLTLWDHIYHAYRLQVIDACKTVTGTIRIIRVEPDGDYHIDLELDAPFAGLINDANRREQHGDLVLEPVCQNPVTQSDAQAACAGFRGTVVIPPVGTHVQVTGAYVLDADHGWMEIHPVTRIDPVP